MASGTERSRGSVAMKAKDQKTKQAKSKDSYTKGELLQMSNEQLIQEILRMQARNHVLDARLLLAETMIDVAEEQFGIPIRKKLTSSSSQRHRESTEGLLVKLL